MNIRRKGNMGTTLESRETETDLLSRQLVDQVSSYSDTLQVRTGELLKTLEEFRRHLAEQEEFDG